MQGGEGSHQLFAMLATPGLGDQVIVFATILLALVLFITGKWRYDVVAGLALMIVVVTGVVPVDQAFVGFAHPAVITVAAVLVISRALLNSGIVDLIARFLARLGNRPTVQVGSLSTVVAGCSAVMNNVGALALLMPVAVQMARRAKHSPSILLMPIAFASLLGGMTTLIGTPPNIIIATFRANSVGEPFRMFDFSYVGLGVAFAAILFISVIGWRLVPQRKKDASSGQLFEIRDYMTEVRVPENSSLAGKVVRDVEEMGEGELTVLGLVRDTRNMPAPSPFHPIKEGDILIVEAPSESIEQLVDAGKLELVGEAEISEEDLKSDDIVLAEAVIPPGAVIIGRTPAGFGLRWRYRVNLLAVAREGDRLTERLGQNRLAVGDVMLLQGPSEAVSEALRAMGCLPLKQRDLRIGFQRRLVPTLAIFVAALAFTVAGVAPVHLTLPAAALLMIMVGLATPNEAYDSIHWPVIILLGALIPVGTALETTGGAAFISSGIIAAADQLPVWATLTVILVGTMFLSDIINNAAAAVLMAPIAVGTAAGIGASPDAFLMAVAIGASCAFLTPIGHQSNTLVMAPGGYKFSDYWRLGLPVEIIITVVSIPLLLRFWPLYP